MFPIVEAEFLAPDVKRFVIEAAPSLIPTQRRERSR
jgi:hypothetical protein